MYALRVAEVLESARTDRIATAVLASQGVTDKTGKAIEITDPQAEVIAFLTRLNEPLNTEQVRKAMLKEVQS